MITPLLLTLNEADNIGRTLERLHWAQEIVVIDSGSTDATLRILAEHPRVRVHHRPFDNHIDQWNHGLDQCRTDWVLSLDADYVLSEELVAELQRWKPDSRHHAWFARFRYCIHGRPLRASLYPPRAVLFDRTQCRYISDGHTQLLRFDGPSGALVHPILHDDRKDVRRWLSEQIRYAGREAEKLSRAAPSTLSIQDRVRRAILPAAPLVLAYTLLFKGLLLDGWAGVLYAFQRAVAESMLSLWLLDLKLRPHRESSDAAPPSRPPE